MTSIGQRIRGWLRGRRRVAGAPPVCSLEAVLTEYLAPGDLAWLVETTPDRRTLFSAAAAAFEVTEDVLVDALAERSGCPRVDRLATFDPELLPTAVTIEMLRRVGVTVVAAERAITTLVVVDPSRVGLLESHFAGIARAVAPWSVIARQLDESEAAAREASAVRESERQARLREVTEMALGIIVGEAEERGYPGVMFDLDGETPRYMVSDAVGVAAHGTVHAMLAPALRELLAREVISVPLTNGFTRVVRVERDESLGRVIVRWDGESASRLTAATAPPVVEPGSNIIVFPRAEGAVGEASQPEVRTPRVLVIDDNQTFAAVLESFLKRSGFVGVHYPSADAAWRALEEGTDLDLIVCDLHMPGMSGLDFVRRFRATAAGEAVPIIMLTSDDDIETELRLLGAGADAFVAKSADPRLLCVQIERLVARHMRRRAA